MRTLALDPCAPIGARRKTGSRQSPGWLVPLTVVLAGFLGLESLEDRFGISVRGTAKAQPLGGTPASRQLPGFPLPPHVVLGESGSPNRSFSLDEPGSFPASSPSGGYTSGGYASGGYGTGGYGTGGYGTGGYGTGGYGSHSNSLYRTADGSALVVSEPYGAPPVYEGLDAPLLPAPDASLYLSPESAPVESGISDYKKSFFQKLAFTGTWVPKTADDELGWTRWDLRLSVAAPAPTIDWPLLITPGFTVYHTDGPLNPDVPPELYEATLGLTWLPKLSDRWRLILSATPGAYSDFEQTKGTALRVTALALAAYDWKPDRLKLIVGAVYLDRDDINVLPAAGLVWTPTPDLKLDVVMPRPRAGWRYHYGPGFEDWVYLAGEIGGGTWQIELADGSTDRITIRDFRLILGAEHKLDGGAGYNLEIGYVFGREIEYRWNPETYTLGDTLMLRAGVAF